MSRPTGWIKVFVDCIHLVFCRLVGLVIGFNAIFNAGLGAVPSSSLKMCRVNMSVFSYFISP